MGLPGWIGPGEGVEQVDDTPRDSRGHGLSGLVWWRLAERLPRHRVSLFLLFAMIVLLVVGVRFLDALDDPKRLAWFLSLYFVFFLVVIGRALFEMFDIVRDHVRAREAVFRETFHEGDLPGELGRRVRDGDRGGWPE